jgi:hypothetical protein
MGSTRPPLWSSGRSSWLQIRRQARAQNVLKICVRIQTEKLIEKVILKIVQMNAEERRQLNVRQFCFSDRHSTALNRMRL